MAHQSNPKSLKAGNKQVGNSSESIEILTVYSPHEANYYLLDDYLKDPTKAKVIKHIEYMKSPVVRLGKVSDMVATDLEAKNRLSNPPSNNRID